MRNFSSNLSNSTTLTPRNWEAEIDLVTKATTSMLYIREIGLIALSIVFIPFSLLVTCVAGMLCLTGLIRTPSPIPAVHRGKQVKVLVTGVSMIKGLFLIRTMYLGGCEVIAADFQNKWIPSCGQFSRACSRFYALQQPKGLKGKEEFFEKMLSLVRKERIDIWISCSGVATATEDAQVMQLIEKHTECRCFQFGEEIITSLDDKYRFMETTASLGLLTPQWFLLDSQRSIDHALQQATNQESQDSRLQYILKNVAMDDKTRGSLPLLRSSEPKHMKAILESIDTKTSQWIMQQFVLGNEEYCTQSLVIDGQVKAFLSCPSESVLLHYKQVESNSILDDAMLKFTQTYATELFRKHGQFTGHLSFDFLALHKPSNQGVTKTLLPIESNPRCHTAVVRFCGREKQLASAYLSILPDFRSGHTIVIPDKDKMAVTYYWIAHDLVDLYVMPILDFCTMSKNILQVLDSHLQFWRLVLFGKDPTFEWWDPVPWFVLNHVYWPARFIEVAFRGIQWSQVNVSTGKIFEA